MVDVCLRHPDYCGALLCHDGLLSGSGHGGLLYQYIDGMYCLYSEGLFCHSDCV